MQCHRCGEALPDGAQYCGACGGAVEAVEDATERARPSRTAVTLEEPQPIDGAPISPPPAFAQPVEPPAALDAELDGGASLRQRFSTSFRALFRPRARNARLGSIWALNVALLLGAAYYFHRYGELRQASAQTAGAVTVGSLRVVRQEDLAARPTPDSTAQAAVQAVVRLHLGDVRDCYQRELGRMPSLAGVIEIAFTIDGEGEASAVRVVSNSTGSATLGTCIVNRLQSWPFPKTATSNTTFDYPFKLHAG